MNTPNETPTITTLNPNAAAVGGPAFTLTVTGTNFVPNSIVRWNGSQRPTSFLSPTLLTAAIQASDIAKAGKAMIDVLRSPGGRLSGELEFIIAAAAPVITGHSPSHARIGSGELICTITGLYFTPTSVVLWNGSPRKTMFVEETQLQVVIPAADLQQPGIASITVLDQQRRSNARFFAKTNLRVVSAAKGENPLAPDSIAVLQGSGLTNNITQQSPNIPLQTTLAGRVVSVLDSADVSRGAPLFCVSPDQIKFQVPSGTQNGEAIVRVLAGSVEIATGVADIARVAPGIFAANPNGTGLALAMALRVSANGSSVFEPIAECNQPLSVCHEEARICVAHPLRLNPRSDQVFLVLFATGLRHHNSPVTAQISGAGGASVSASFAGSQGHFVGLDQVNLLIPHSLAGSGNVGLYLTVDGVRSNTVQIDIA